MNTVPDLRALWDQAKARGLTYEKAAQLLEKQWLGKWGVSTVRDAVLGKGSESRENQLRVTLQKYLQLAETAGDENAESAFRVSDAPPSDDLRTELEIWKRRAKDAERQLENLRNGLRSLLELSSPTPKPSTSSSPPSDAGRLAMRAAEGTEKKPQP